MAEEGPKQLKRVNDHLVRAWLTNSHVASFQVIKPFSFEHTIVETGERVERPTFERRDQQGVTENIEEAVAVAHGSVKWDGCTDFVVEEDDNCMAHACGLSDFRDLLAAVAEARRFAASLLEASPENHNGTWPVNLEYELDRP